MVLNIASISLKVVLTHYYPYQNTEILCIAAHLFLVCVYALWQI